MNIRIGDIIEFLEKGEEINLYKIGKVVYHKNKRVQVSLINDDKVETTSLFMKYSDYKRIYIDKCDIIKIIKRKRGKAYKKRNYINLIDDDGNITYR